MAIFQSTSSAQNLLDASPLRFELQEGRSEWKLIASDSSALDVTEKNWEKEEWVVFEEEQQRLNRKQETEQKDEESTSDKIISVKGVGLQSSTSIAGETPFPIKGGNTRWGTTFASAKLEQSTFTPSSSPPPSPPRAPPPPTFAPNPLPPNPTNTFADAPCPPPSESSDLPASQQRRELHLSISRSYTNHQAYIKRQGYYGGFRPNTKTIMAEDLEYRVPLAGMVDVSLSKEEVPLRIRKRKQEKQAQRRTSLREMWEEGRRERAGSTV